MSTYLYSEGFLFTAVFVVTTMYITWQERKASEDVQMLNNLGVGKYIKIKLQTSKPHHREKKNLLPIMKDPDTVNIYSLKCVAAFTVLHTHTHTQSRRMIFKKEGLVFKRGKKSKDRILLVLREHTKSVLATSITECLGFEQTGIYSKECK